MQNITVRFGKHDGELKPLTTEDAAKYFEFRKELIEGEVIELYITKIVKVIRLKKNDIFVNYY